MNFNLLSIDCEDGFYFELFTLCHVSIICFEVNSEGTYFEFMGVTIHGVQ